MLDGLLGKGFAGKCKSLIKQNKSRIDVIRRKRNATQKFLKKDIADLLASGLDINAYGRAEGLMVELILSSCYDFVEKCCDVVLKALPVMQKLRECPEDCKEAVSCMMFAAARFSDLPELRDLRQLFHERYGNSLELAVNQQFVENLGSTSTTMEKKIKLLHDIALEFSITWDSRDFECRMAKPAVVPQDQPKKYGPTHIKNDKPASNHRHFSNQPAEKTNFATNRKLELSNDEYHLQNGREGKLGERKPSKFTGQPRNEISVEEYKPHKYKEESIVRKETRDVLGRGKQEVAAARKDPHVVDGNIVSKTARLSSSPYEKSVQHSDVRLRDAKTDVRKIEILDMATQGRTDLKPGYSGSQLNAHRKQPFAGYDFALPEKTPNSTMRGQEGDTPASKSHYRNILPPPYVKPNTKAKESKESASIGASYTDFDGIKAHRDPSAHHRAPVNRAEREPQELNHPNPETRPISSPGRRIKELQNGHAYMEDVNNPIPKPRSSRRRHKSNVSHGDLANGEDKSEVKRRSRSRRRDDPRRGLQLLFDDEKDNNDEEERIIDKLLMHYSKKPTSDEQAKSRRRLRSHRGHGGEEHAGEASQNGKTVGPDETPEIVPHPPRSISLPNDHISSPEVQKVFGRAASFQDRSAPHVHPKLPDYDDLAARFAALKGR